MPQINKGYTYTDGMQVNAANLNQMLDSASLGGQSITSQTAITDGIVALDDYINIYDTSTTNLRKATIGNILTSNLPLSSTVINSVSDISIIPTDGTTLTLKAYASIDGITTTVTSTAHGLTTGQIVTISSATNSSYNGTFKITVTSSDTFTYTTSSVIGVLSGTGTSSNTTTTGTVTSVAHGLTNGMLVKVQVYNSSGVLIPAYTVSSVTVTVTGVNTFTYIYSYTSTASSGNSVVWQTLTPLPSTGTLTYQRKGSERLVGNRITTGNLYTEGTILANGANITGSIVASGNIKTNSLSTIGDVNSDGNIFAKTFQVLPRFDYFVQTRTQNTYTSGWGGAQNGANLYGTNISELNITFTPKKAGNTIVLQWDVTFSNYYSSDAVWVVTRTPLSGVSANTPVALPYAVDDNNNTWSGVCSLTPQVNETSATVRQAIKIVDLSSLDVSCTYKLHFRSANNRTTSFSLNRPMNATNQLDYEVGMSVGHAHEICV